jgi:uncharacterized protein YPO0396
MSIYSQYADTVRESQVTWDRAVEVFTDNAKNFLGQVEQSFASALEADATSGAFDYLKRNLDAQRDVSKKFAALSAQFSERVIAQGESLANAARDYAGGAQEVLRDQAGKQYDEFAAARQRAEDALRHGSAAAAPAPATLHTEAKTK